MRERPVILVVDDAPDNIEIVRLRLESQAYDVITAADGLEALEQIAAHLPDLVLLDVMMPRLDGIQTIRRLRADTSLPFIPVIMLTAQSDRKEVVAGLDAGADEYLTKPFDAGPLLARVRAMLRMKALHDEVRTQAAQLALWNQTLEQRVADQLASLTHLDSLKRFLAPQIAELVMSSGDEILRSHRGNVAVVFCDLRGFTAFAETAEPEEVMTILGEYHACAGAIIHKFQGTIEHFAGDGLMAMLNDPLPCAEPCLQAVRMAAEMRAEVGELTAKWRKHGFELGFGIAYSYATLGRIGFEGRFDYAAIGAVPNLAARLCDEAKDGQILIDGKVKVAVEAAAQLEPLEELRLKGFHRPIKAFNVRGVSG